MDRVGLCGWKECGGISCGLSNPTTLITVTQKTSPWERNGIGQGFISMVKCGPCGNIINWGFMDQCHW